VAEREKIDECSCITFMVSTLFGRQKKLMEHFAFIVVTKPTWLLEVVQFRRRKHGNLTRCAQKPVYNAVAVFQSGTLNEIKTWVC